MSENIGLCVLRDTAATVKQMVKLPQLSEMSVTSSAAL
jgi:hypothetical protein